ncbi:helix-turn-helix domain-containing protein [Streptomyces sp. NRRL F-5126]|uniref:helix-turn-helix domain-containing protein n=1 Tax=Streptomyces sp. NRRL F-5126 TaxID=1463857 RepID=UPI00056BCE92|nr:XRE family transcriptional regulator [Streptomyces sp. NRRL F-5126]
MTGTAAECALLAERLRELRARTGLSLAALAERTAYSKSSWDRYLGGKKPAPRQAVQALCALAGEDSGPLIALWELADAQWSGRSSAAPAAAAPPAAGTAEAAELPRRAGHRRPLLIGAGAAALAAVAALTALSLSGADTGHRTVVSPALSPTPGCRGRTCEGKDPGPMSCALPDRSEVLGPRHRTRTGAFVQLRYSKACAAAWGRFWHARIGDAIEVSAPGGPPRRAEATGGGDTKSYLFTHMVDASDLTGLRVCFDPVGAGPRECFRP